MPSQSVSKAFSAEVSPTPPQAEAVPPSRNPFQPYIYSEIVEQVRNTYPVAAQAIRAEAERLTPLPPSRPILEEVAGIEVAALAPKRGRGAGGEGAGLLMRHLHLLACHAADERGYSPQAACVVIHQSNELLAAAFEVSPRTVRRWAIQLEAQGVIASREHYGTSTNEAGERVTWITGTLYAIRLQPGHVPRISAADLRHPWRNLDADRAAGRTAYRYGKLIKAVLDEEKNMSVSTDPPEGGAADLHPTALACLRAWAVTAGGPNFDCTAPRYIDTDIFPAEGGNTVQDVIYGLPVLMALAPPERRLAVHETAISLASALNDEHSRAYYARLVWEAIRAEGNGTKGLQHLAAALARLEVDRREWPELRNPAALLTTRLRGVA